MTKIKLWNKRTNSYMDSYDIQRCDNEVWFLFYDKTKCQWSSEPGSNVCPCAPWDWDDLYMIDDYMMRLLREYRDGLSIDDMIKLTRFSEEEIAESIGDLLKMKLIDIRFDNEGFSYFVVA